MKHLIFLSFTLASLFVFNSCEKTESEPECGQLEYTVFDVGDELFASTANIYWGEINGIRSYTANFPLHEICTGQNPKVNFTVGLVSPNAGAANPISIDAGVHTCLGVQPQTVIMEPNGSQNLYFGGPSEIGLNQCFSGQTSASIYPYLTLSFNTLGSSYADSLFLSQGIETLVARIEFRKPK